MSNVHPKLGAIKDPEDSRDFAFKAILKAPIKTPDVVDYESKMTPIKNQGNRGACVAFSTDAVKEYQEGKQRSFKSVYDFSEEWVYDQIMVPGGGAYIRDAFKVLQESGVCREKYMPYDYSKSDDDARTFTPTKSAIYNAKFYKARTFARLTSLEQMIESLVINGPFVIGVNWLNDWFNPKTISSDGYPVLKPGTSGSAGGHAIAVVGYDRPRNVLKFKNSWGDGWGKKGYAFFHFDVVKSNLLDAWATIDITAPQIDKKKVKELHALVE